jgi:hypothetical protein
MPDKNNYLNLSQRDRRMRIYRIISVARMYEMFDTRTSVLVNPNKWKDPFESVVHAIFPTVGLFGQCWTRHTASDAMWRIYSPNSCSVRIRVKLNALVTTLSRSLCGTCGIAFIGSVKYLPQQKLIRLITDLASNHGVRDPVQQATTLLLKRFAFRHEREVRLLLVNGQRFRDQDRFAYAMNPHEVVDQIMLDPRLAKEHANRLREEIRHRTGFKGSIKRSLLYTLPRELSRLERTESCRTSF